VLRDLKIQPSFDLHSTVPPGVLIYPMFLKDSVLYVIESEDAHDSDVDLTDRLTNARLTIHLSSQHAALALIQKSDGKILAKYGF
jgi:hypothetical protein